MALPELQSFWVMERCSWWSRCLSVRQLLELLFSVHQRSEVVFRNLTMEWELGEPAVVLVQWWSSLLHRRNKGSGCEKVVLNWEHFKHTISKRISVTFVDDVVQCRLQGSDVRVLIQLELDCGSRGKGYESNLQNKTKKSIKIQFYARIAALVYFVQHTAQLFITNIVLLRDVLYLSWIVWDAVERDDVFEKLQSDVVIIQPHTPRLVKHEHHVQVGIANCRVIASTGKWS